jgi:hypothetical protein
LSEKFTLKILTFQTYLVGGKSENAGKFLSLPNGLFGFLPTFYPKKTSNLTDRYTKRNDLEIPLRIYKAGEVRSPCPAEKLF